MSMLCECRRTPPCTCGILDEDYIKLWALVDRSMYAEIIIKSHLHLGKQTPLVSYKDCYLVVPRNTDEAFMRILIQRIKRNRVGLEDIHVL